MADYTLKDGKGTKVRESGALEEAYEDLDINGLPESTSPLIADQMAIQRGSNDPQKMYLYTFRSLLDQVNRNSTLWVPADKMVPSQTSGASLVTVEYPTNDLTHKVMRFPGSGGDTSAEFNVIFPWNFLSTYPIPVRMMWTAGGDANPGEWIGFSIAARSYADGDPMDEALGGTPRNIYDQLIADDDMHIAQTEYDLIIGNLPSDYEVVHFKLTRDYDYANGGSAMDVDCDVFGVLIQFLCNFSTTGW